jgi:hypothetical protein
MGICDVKLVGSHELVGTVIKKDISTSGVCRIW